VIYLASRSPRRRQLLEQLQVSFRVLHVDVDEARTPGESCEDMVRRLAALKAESGALLLGDDHGAPVLGADTIVVLGNQVLGKPRDDTHAREMLMGLSDRDHRVLSAVALAVEGDTRIRLSESRVWFRGITESECRAYSVTDEPLDKAGAYAIQGGAAAFVTRLEGSYSGVVGLPLHETAELLCEAGIELFKGDD
jgi:septum formation protein